MNVSSPRRAVARLVAHSLFALVVICTSIVSARAVTIDWVTVGDPGNAADTTGYGSVAEEFRIGKYEVMIQQYTDFLNAVAATDPYQLFFTVMSTDLNSAGISQNGSSGSYSYSVIGSGNRPITYVSWFAAARFANWMQNGQGSGGTESGAYTLNGATGGNAPAVNPGATFYIPTEDQWYKAAYYKGGGTNAGYWDYATRSDSTPGNVIGSGVNQANYYGWFGGSRRFSVTQSSTYSSSQNYLTDIGAFTNSSSAYGTFDQTGNVWEWNDLTGATGSRGLRGGGWDIDQISSSDRYTTFPSNIQSSGGFRLASPVASPVPEIESAGFGSVAAILMGALGLLERRRVKAKPS